MTHAHSRVAFAVLMFALVRTATAAGINDPTRPPQPAPRATPSMPVVAPELVLQSVRISPEGSYAIINGRLVALGGRIGDARVIQISEDEVVIDADGDWQTLKLYPGVRKGASNVVSRSSAGRVVQPAPVAGRLTRVVFRNRMSK